MSQLLVQEQAGEITVELDERSKPPRTLTRHRFESVVTPDELADLRWYVEDYADAPFGAYRRRADAIASNLVALGNRLYGVAFGALADQSIAEIAGEPAPEICFCSTSPRFLSLPWELLRRPGDSGPLALSHSHIFRCMPDVLYGNADVLIPAQARVLFVVARPSGKRDVAYTLISRPVAQALHQSPIRIEVLRPPTVRNFLERLSAARDAGDPYSIVHFDGHGALAFVGSTGVEGSVYFEGPGNTPEPLAARQLALQLGEAGVKLAIFNACESARIEGATPEAVVASALLRAGVPATLGMAYSVRTVTAQRFMTSLYTSLATGASLWSAAATARREVAKLRTDIEADDWFVPVLYAHANVHLPRGDYDRSLQLTHEVELIGRDADFYTLEAAIREHDALLIHGLAGIGKSRFLLEFSQWLVQTGGAASERTYTIHLDRLSNSEQCIQLQELRNAIASGSALPHHLLVLIDGLENLDPAIRFELNEVLALVRTQQQALVLMASRTPETWLGEHVERLALLPLRFTAAAELVQRVGTGRMHASWIEMCAGVPSVICATAKWEVAQLVWPTAWDVQTLNSETIDALLHIMPELNGLMARIPVALKSLCRLLAFFARIVEWEVLCVTVALSTSGLPIETDGPPMAGGAGGLPPQLQNTEPKEWLELLDALCSIGLARRIVGAVFEVHPLVGVWVVREWCREAGFEQQVRQVRRAMIGCISSLAFASSQKVEGGGNVPITLPDYAPVLRHATFASVRDGWPNDAALIFNVLRQSNAARHGSAPGDEMAIQLREAILDRLGRRPRADDPEQFLWLSLQTNLHPYAGRNPARQEMVEEDARRLLEEVPRTAETAHLRIFARSNLGAVAGNRGDNATSEQHYKAAIEEAYDPHDPHLLSAYRNLGVIAFDYQRFQEAKEWLSRARLSAQNADQFIPVDQLIAPMEAIIELYLGDPAKALDLQDAAQAAEQLPSLDSRAATFHELGVANLAVGRLDVAETYFRRALQLKHQIGKPEAMTTTFMALCDLEQRRSDLTKAETWLREALRNEEAWPSKAQPKILGGLANNLALQGRSDEARQLILGAVETQRANPRATPHDDTLLITAAEHAQRNHDPATIVRLLEQRFTGTDSGFPMSLEFRGVAHGLLAEGYLLTKRPVDAREAVNIAIDCLQELAKDHQDRRKFNLAHAVGIRALLRDANDPMRIDDAFEAAQRFVELHVSGTKEASHYLLLTFLMGIDRINPTDLLRSERALSLFEQLCEVYDPRGAGGQMPQIIVRIGRLVDTCSLEDAVGRFVRTGTTFLLRSKLPGDNLQAFAECIYVPAHRQNARQRRPNMGHLQHVASLLRAFPNEANACRMLCAYFSAIAVTLVEGDSAAELTLCCDAVRERIQATGDPNAVFEFSKLLMYLVTHLAARSLIDEGRRAMQELQSLMTGETEGALILSFLYAGRNFGLALIAADQATEERVLATRLLEQLQRLPGAALEVLADEVTDYFSSAACAHARRGNSAEVIRSVQALQSLVRGAAEFPAGDFAVANALLNAGTAAAMHGDLKTLTWIHDEMAAALYSTDEVRIAGGLLIVDRALLYHHTEAGESSGAAAIVSEMLDLWRDRLCDFDQASDEIVDMLDNALELALSVIVPRQDMRAVEDLGRSIAALDVGDPRLARIKARFSVLQ